MLQLGWPFVEVLDYILAPSHILLVGSQNVPDYPLFAPQLGYANQVISWGKAPFDANRLQALTEANHITHILIQNDQQLDFHWDSPLSTGEMVSWLAQQSDFNEIPIATDQMRLFETVQAKQIRLDKIEKQLEILHSTQQNNLITIDPALANKVGLTVTPVQRLQNLRLPPPHQI